MTKTGKTKTMTHYETDRLSVMPIDLSDFHVSFCSPSISSIHFTTTI